jgi:hypothetical protein
MKKSCIVLILWSVLLSMRAGLAWPEPVVVAEMPNIDYVGVGATAPNGNTLLTWTEIVGGTNTLCFNLFDTQSMPLWPQPLQLTAVSYHDLGIVATPTGDFILTLVKGMEFYAWKISQNGTHLWDPEGICIFTFFLGYYPDIIRDPVADNTGGFWILCWINDQDMVQHVSSNGVPLFPLTGLQLNPDDTHTSVSYLCGLPDDGILIAYTEGVNYPGLLRVRRLSPLGADVWPQPLTPVGGSVGPPKLSMFDADSFVVSWSDNQAIWLGRYDLNSDSLWAAPLLAIPGYIGANSNRTILIPSSDNCLFISSRTWDGIMALQKVSASGQPLFGAGTTLDPSSIRFSADDAGGCYVGIADDDIRLAYVNSSGEQVWGESGIPICDEISHPFSLYLDFGGNTILYWMNVQAAGRGIYRQQVTPAGVTIFEENGEPLHAGDYGDIIYHQVRAMQDDTVLVWLQRSQNSGNYQLRMQKILSDGSFEFGTEGFALSSHCITDYTYKRPSVVMTPDEEIFVSWYDSVAGDYKMQLYDTAGDPLWGTDPISVSGIGIYAQAVYLDGGFIIVHKSTSGSGTVPIRGQRIVDGVPVWPAEGIQLVAPHPDYPSSGIQFLGAIDNYLVWTLTQPDQVFALRINAGGSPVTGFNAWGNQISQRTDPFNLDDVSFDQLGGNLYCRWHEIWVDPEYYEGTVRHIQQVINPQGDLLIDAPGVVDIVMIDMFYGFEVGVGDDCFLTGNGGLYSYHLRRFTPTGVLLNESNLSLCPEPPYAGDVLYLTALSDGNALIMFDNESDETRNLRFHLADPQGDLVSPALNTIFEATPGDDIYLSVWPEEDVVQIAGVISPHYANVAASTIMLQKIVPAGSPILDTESIPALQFELSLNWPNPFSVRTEFYCQIEKNQAIEISVYNLRGQKVRSIFDGDIDAGRTFFSWDGKDDHGRTAANGIYLIRARMEDQTSQRKMLKLK